MQAGRSRQVHSSEEQKHASIYKQELDLGGQTEPCVSFCWQWPWWSECPAEARAKHRQLTEESNKKVRERRAVSTQISASGVSKWM